MEQETDHERRHHAEQPQVCEVIHEPALDFVLATSHSSSIRPLSHFWASEATGTTNSANPAANLDGFSENRTRYAPIPEATTSRALGHHLSNLSIARGTH